MSEQPLYCTSTRGTDRPDRQVRKRVAEHCHIPRELRWWPDSAEDEADLQLRRERDLLLSARNSLKNILTKV